MEMQELRATTRHGPSTWVMTSSFSFRQLGPELNDVDTLALRSCRRAQKSASDYVCEPVFLHCAVLSSLQSHRVLDYPAIRPACRSHTTASGGSYRVTDDYSTSYMSRTRAKVTELRYLCSPQRKFDLPRRHWSCLPAGGRKPFLHQCATHRRASPASS